MQAFSDSRAARIRRRSGIHGQARMSTAIARFRATAGPISILTGRRLTFANRRSSTVTSYSAGFKPSERYRPSALVTVVRTKPVFGCVTGDGCARQRAAGRVDNRPFDESERSLGGCGSREEEQEYPHYRQRETKKHGPSQLDRLVHASAFNIAVTHVPIPPH
jgi:hypothetical protein